MVLAIRPAIFDRHVLPFNKSDLLQPLAKRSIERRIAHASPAAEISDHRQLLCARNERARHCGTAEAGNELAPFHARPSLLRLRFYSIISSARAISVGGMARPIDFAVPRLITSSNLFGNCTGS